MGYLDLAKLPNGEYDLDKIAESAYNSYQYARYVLQARFLPGEEAILTNVHWTTMYAIIVLNQRWPEGEEVIKTDPYYLARYREQFGRELGG